LNNSGHLPNSKHYPSCNFDESQCASIAADHAQQPKDIIFHCMLSQVRGPTCAGRFAEYLNSHHPTAKCRVLILKGGFQHWVATASQQPESSKYVLSFDRDAFENDM
jgi:Cdc25 family phosphatase